MTRHSPGALSACRPQDADPGITCLAWKDDGELDGADRDTLVSRLARTDPLVSRELRQRQAARCLTARL